MPDPIIDWNIGANDGSVGLVTWALTTADPTGTAISFPEYADRGWHIEVDTTGGATFTLQGSNTDVEADYATLSKADGGAAFTATTQPVHKTVVEGSLYMRPKLTTVGVAAVWNVSCLIRRPTDMRQ